MSPSAFMRAHTIGRLKTNPPAGRRKRTPWYERMCAAKAAKKKHRGRGAKKRLRTNPAEPRLKVTRLGKAMRLDYIHHANGKGYKHEFSKRAPVYTTDDGQFLVIGPVSVKHFIED